jgi:hypothetical protein
MSPKAGLSPASTLKGGLLLSTTYCWWQSYPLPRRLWHPYSRHAHHQNPTQQCHLHKRSQIHDNWYKGFLPLHTHGMTRVHVTLNCWHARGCHHSLQTLCSPNPW